VAQFSRVRFAAMCRKGWFADMPDSLAYQIPTLTKVAAENRVYLVDFSKYPEIVAGETIASSTVPAVTGLTLGSTSTISTATDGVPAGKGVKFTISGGTAGTTYSVDCQMTTSGGSVLVRRFQLQVI